MSRQDGEKLKSVRAEFGDADGLDDPPRIPHHLFPFVAEAVQLLCDTLKFEARLPLFFRFVLKYVPIKKIILSRALEDLKMVEGIAVCTEDGAQIDVERQSQVWDESVLPEHIARQLAEGKTVGLYAADDSDPVAPYFCNRPSLMRDAEIVTPFFAMRMQQADLAVGSILFIGCRPFTDEELAYLRALRLPVRIAINNWSQYHALEELKERIAEENRLLHSQMDDSVSEMVIGAHGGLLQQMKMARMVAGRNIPVLITGETGTGKDIFAQVVHGMSDRKDKPFVVVNCGAIPISLIDSELFGHVKGAFTGAVNMHKGRFEKADGGTIFLDEIAELPLEIQARLLRVLQEHVVERVGGDKPVPVDFRLIAATNRDLAGMVRRGEFREDLYYRIRVFPIHLPPLRERRQDIPSLVRHLLLKAVGEYGITLPRIAQGEMARLMSYNWPGNIRELQNVLEESLVLMSGGELSFHLPASEKPHEEKPKPGQALVPTLDEALREYFFILLAACGNRIGGAGNAADLAGIKSNTLRSKLDKLGIPYRQRDV